MLVVEKIEKSFSGRRVLDIGRWEVKYSDSVAIVGSNGAGKTTLLEIIAGLQSADRGKVIFNGKPVINPVRAIGIVLQEPVMFSRSVAWNLGFGLRKRGLSKQEIADRINESLDLVGLNGFQNRDATRLSIGEKRRVAIARAIAPDPELLLLDEPSGGVDSDSVRRITDVLRNLVEEGRSIVVATHDMDFASRFAGRIDLLRNGEMDPYLGENQFSCLIECENGNRIAVIRDSLKFEVPGEFSGMADIALTPDQISLSHEKSESVGLNSYPGKLINLSHRNGSIEVQVDIGVPVRAKITYEKLKELGMTVGDTVYTSFKARDILIFPRDGETLEKPK